MSESDLALDRERHAVLLVGGLDTSGGAGILLDARVVDVRGLHAVAAATSVAVQNTSRLVTRYDLPASVFKAQLAVLAEEFLLGAVKTGVLPTVEIVEALAEFLAARPRLPLVIDPVFRSTSGGELVDATAIDAITRLLFPRARVLTPNLDEATALTGRAIRNREDLPEVADLLLGLGPEWVLVKGGHLSRDGACDYLASKDGGTWLDEEARLYRDTRGTGCALASALAAGLAHGEPVPEAAQAAKALVTAALDAGYVSGRGRFLDPQPE